MCFANRFLVFRHKTHCVISLKLLSAILVRDSGKNFTFHIHATDSNQSLSFLSFFCFYKLFLFFFIFHFDFLCDDLLLYQTITFTKCVFYSRVALFCFDFTIATNNKKRTAKIVYVLIWIVGKKNCCINWKTFFFLCCTGEKKIQQVWFLLGIFGTILFNCDTITSLVGRDSYCLDFVVRKRKFCV